jgi:hypothetical protein
LLCLEDLALANNKLTVCFLFFLMIWLFFPFACLVLKHILYLVLWLCLFVLLSFCRGSILAWKDCVTSSHWTWPTTKSNRFPTTSRI